MNNFTIITTYHIEVETTKRGTYYSLVDNLGGEDACIRVTNNKITWYFGKSSALMQILKEYPKLQELEVDVE